MDCPLCGGASGAFAPGASRGALRCGTCVLTFVPPERRVSLEAEKARYAQHDNRPDDPGYRAFLDRLLKPLGERLAPGAEGLDFGCGPGPTASVMMAERGFKVTDYDLHFRDDAAALTREYDFVVSTEVFEHLREPRATLDQIDRCLRPRGVFGIMTNLLVDDAGFAAWWYQQDPTHILFYKGETLRWIADSRKWDLELLPGNAALFHKPP